MSNPTRLTPEQLEQLASRTGVKRIAVENFLMSVPLTTEHPYGARGCAEVNLSGDAIAYRWNAATVKAIRDGLRLIFG